ncbi:MAG: IMP cyclohydrolase [Oscillospiraceae bacterium]|jgi:IMP cyclohydrolase|nr:IMP cyclohydrolase [Oscillospiraceae bacterium]
MSNLHNISDFLIGNRYPGRGILIGRAVNKNSLFVAYFIMGRSENSRNRVFVRTDDGIKTVAADPSKLTDPSLVIYHPVRKLGDALIVTNGDQTDTIRDALSAGRKFHGSVMSREFEPDPPIYTPRISAILRRGGAFTIAIAKNVGADTPTPAHYFFEFANPETGVGRFISTYAHDGNPPPSFSGEPVAVALPETLDALCDGLWSALDEDNKVALYVREVDIATGDCVADAIVNKYTLLETQ